MIHRSIRTPFRIGGACTTTILLTNSFQISEIYRPRIKQGKLRTNSGPHKSQRSRLFRTPVRLQSPARGLRL